MLVSGLALFISVRAALLSSVEDTARDSALAIASTVNAGKELNWDEMRRFSLQGIFVIVRDGDGTMLVRTVDLPDESQWRDPVWRRALQSGQPIGGTVQIGEGAPAYVFAVPVEPPRGKARVVE